MRPAKPLLLPFLLLLLLPLLLSCLPALATPSSTTSAREPSSDARSFVISGRQFLKDGQPFQLVSGSVHYFRHHPSTYADRLAKAKACGLNAVQTYVSWLRHEPLPGQFQRMDDLTGFLDAAAQAGLLVILRPGPYICAEYSFGGMPGWLLQNGTDSISLRTADPLFLSAVDRWFDVLLPTLRPYLYSNGGPVVLAQVDNEAGYYVSPGGGGDDAYLAHIRDAYVSAWGAGAVVLHSTDGTNETLLWNSKLDGVYSTVDFGPPSNGADGLAPLFALQDAANGGVGPHMNSEFYVGGMNRNWGDPAYANDTAAAINASVTVLEALVASGASLNMYMFSGGTNWGFEAGLHSGTSARWNVGAYVPGGPLSEAGDPTDLFLPVCNAIAAGRGQPQPPGPLPAAVAPKSSYAGTLAMDAYATLWDALPALISAAAAGSDGVLVPRTSHRPLPFEALALEGGYALYTTSTRVNLHADLSNLYIREVRDRAYIFQNRTRVAVLQRPLVNTTWLPFPPFPPTAQASLLDPHPSVFDILVENEGRTCFGPWLNKDAKGLTSPLQLGPWAQPYVWNWTVVPLPFGNMTSATLGPDGWTPLAGSGWNASAPIPVLYKALLQIDRATTPVLLDSFLDMRGWGKGWVAINGVNLGRFWYLGPEYSLYVPAGILRYGSNDVVVFEADGVMAGCGPGAVGEPPRMHDDAGGGGRRAAACGCPPDAGTVPLHAAAHVRGCRCDVTSLPVRHADACPRAAPFGGRDGSIPTVTFRTVPVRDLPQEVEEEEDGGRGLG
jgi:beta-galactosidase